MAVYVLNDEKLFRDRTTSLNGMKLKELHNHLRMELKLKMTDLNSNPILWP